MIVDSSALIAILFKEKGWDGLLDAMGSAEQAPGVGAPTLAETGIVLAARLGVPGKSLLARLVHEADLRVVPLTQQHWPVAVDAYLRFGKGRHRAGLNFGDCLTYATCRIEQEPLLCVGNDFRHTDLNLVP